MISHAKVFGSVGLSITLASCVLARPILSTDAAIPSATTAIEPTTVAISMIRPQPSHSALEWAEYIDPDGRFRFEYPAIYDSKRYADRGCGPQADGDQVSVTPRIGVTWQPADGKDLEAIVEAYKDSIEEPGEVEVSNTVPTNVSGRAAMSVEYRVGDARRLGITQIVLGGDRMYQIEYADGLECFVDDQTPFFLLDVYAHLVDSFRVEDRP